MAQNMGGGNNSPVPVQVLQGQPGSVPASSLFGLPGITQWSEQRENLDGTVTTLAQGSQVDAIFASNFKLKPSFLNFRGKLVG